VARIAREELPDGPLEEWTEGWLREERRKAAAAVLAEQRLPDYIAEALSADLGTGSIIGACRYLCAATDPDLLPGLDDAVHEHEMNNTLPELADQLAEALVDGTLTKVILLLEPGG
jgi:hypothetical protein